MNIKSMKGKSHEEIAELVETACGPGPNYKIENLMQLRDFPMIELFSPGEIGSGADSRTEFYDRACSPALLKKVA